MLLTKQSVLRACIHQPYIYIETSTKINYTQLARAQLIANSNDAILYSRTHLHTYILTYIHT